MIPNSVVMKELELERGLDPILYRNFRVKFYSKLELDQSHQSRDHF